MTESRAAPSPCSRNVSRLCLKSPDGEELSLLDGTSWHVSGLYALITATWKVGDEIASSFDELFHCRTSEHVYARRARVEKIEVNDRRRTH